MIKEVYGTAPTLPEGVLKKSRVDVISKYYLTQYALCKDLRCLPKAGGLGDQDHLVVHFFGVIGAKIAEHQERMSKSK